MIKTNLGMGYDKITDASKLIFKKSVELNGLKNSGETAVLTVLSDTDEKGLKLVIKGLPKNITYSLYEEHTIEIKGVKWPDPITDIKDKFDVSAGEIKNILIRFEIASETKAGTYSINADIKKGLKTCSKSNISLKVFDVALPEKPTFVTALGLDEEHLLPRFHGFDFDDSEESKAKEHELYKIYYDYMLDRGICAFDLPYDVLDPRADVYMSDPRVTSFVVRERISRDDGDEMLAKRCEKLRTNPEWMKKAYIYPFDEPNDKEALDKIRKRSLTLKQICPEMRQISPFFANIDYDETRDEISALGEFLEILCPKLACFNDDFIYNADQKARSKPFATRMTEYQNQGKDLWAYVCWEPGAPYTNVFVNEEGINHRILFWQMYSYGVTGFLYWRVNYWDKIEDPWKDMATVPYLSPDVFGDGSLLYNGTKYGIFGPCGSVRFEAIRDGIRDCELLMLAEKKLGKEKVMSFVSNVTTNVTEYNPSPDNFNAVRKELLMALESNK